MSTREAARQAGTFTAVTYALAFVISLSLPHRGIAALLTAVAPAVAVGITIPATLARGHRWQACRDIGWRRPRVRSVTIALLLPAVLAFASFGTAVLTGVARFSWNVSWNAVFGLCVALAVGTFLILGEEVGWRGFLLPRLTLLMPRRRAWLLTGATHGIFHLPLLLLTSVYQSAGNRWIVVPTVVVTITLAGVSYGWVRDLSGGVWAVALMHNTFNTYFETLTAAAIARSEAVLAYVTTETGVATLAAVALTAAWLLHRDPDSGGVQHPRVTRSTSHSEG